MVKVVHRRQVQREGEGWAQIIDRTSGWPLKVVVAVAGAV